MPATVFVHDGDAIDYTPGADVAAGDVVVQGELVGVAKLDIKANLATTTAAGNKLIGKTVKAAADADATVRVRMLQ